MIPEEIILEIISVYLKHGWEPKEALLSEAVDSEALGGIPRRQAAFDAVWFERRSADGKLAVELRLLTEAPYAVFELVDNENASDVMERIEARMADHTSKDG